MGVQAFSNQELSPLIPLSLVVSVQVRGTAHNMLLRCLTQALGEAKSGED